MQNCLQHLQKPFNFAQGCVETVPIVSKELGTGRKKVAHLGNDYQNLISGVLNGEIS